MFALRSPSVAYDPAMTAPGLLHASHDPVTSPDPLDPLTRLLPSSPASAPAGPLTTAARLLAESLLGEMGDRWLHTRGVAERAAGLAAPLGVDADLLTAAAWLHDIGYAERTVVTGFHPLDGADHLTRGGWPVRVAGLVAYHSGARFVAAARGLSEALAVYPDERTVLADALTYADQTVGPDGARVDPASRYAEMLHRHGPCSWNARVDADRGPYLRAIARRVEYLLSFTEAGALP
ncbi:HDIG domain-containing protein [Actinoplanes regularis]|uniref:HDIG domain-containing protein n=2 Tax=Actinoplanes regularis TaxID=52697 RepID=A0A239EW54_9ACTN|nr:HDIG domain-containing protein [Actinoplanes regularis]